MTMKKFVNVCIIASAVLIFGIALAVAIANRDKGMFAISICLVCYVAGIASGKMMAQDGRKLSRVQASLERSKRHLRAS